ncbi:hypothetical protein ABBQ32_007766 [Trebouxia sp. C0010 RCD-2024]
MAPTKVALVTGANKGIGKEIARGLAKQGFTVLIGARKQELGEAAATELAKDGQVRSQQLDVTDVKSVTAAAAAVEQKYGHLDVLVNNAGIAVGPDGSLANISDLPVESAAKTLNYVFDTNVFAVVTVTNAFLPLLKAAPSARIVNVSSIAASLTHGVMVQPYAVYSSSKTALNAVTLHYAKDLAETNIKVNMICPGYCATEINGHSGPRSAAEGAEIAIKMATLPNVGPHGGFYDDNGSIPW